MMTQSRRSQLFGLRITITLLALIPVAFLLLAVAYGSIMGRLSPTYREPSAAEPIFGLLVACVSLYAIWSSSRTWLIIATVALLPTFIGCVLLAVIIPHVFLVCLLLLILWIIFFHQSLATL